MSQYVACPEQLHGNANRRRCIGSGACPLIEESRKPKCCQYEFCFILTTFESDAGFLFDFDLIRLNTGNDIYIINLKSTIFNFNFNFIQFIIPR